MDTQFEEMRQQMETLKKKLEKQEIVNEHFIRKSMKKSISSINNRYLWLIVLALLMIPYGYYVFVIMMGYSLTFWVATTVFMLICCGYTYWNGKDIRDNQLMGDNLIEVRQKVATAKKRDSDWLMYGIPMLVAWLAFFAYEVYAKGGKEEMMPLLLGGGLGVIIGGTIGLWLHFKTQRNYQDVLDQIEELTL
jgi:hypothetical protein